MSNQKLTKVAYNYIDDLLEKLRQSMDAVSKKTPFDQKAYNDLETRWRVLQQKRYSPYQDATLPIQEGQKSLYQNRQYLSPEQTAQGEDTSRMAPFHQWENKGGLQSIKKVPSGDPAQPDWVSLPDLKFMGSAGNNPAEFAQYIKTQMGDALTLQQTGDPKAFKPSFDTYIRGTQEAWNKFVGLAPHVFDNVKQLPTAKSLGLKGEKDYNAEYKEDENAVNPFPLGVQVINKDSQDHWEVGAKKNEKSYKPGIRLTFDTGDKNFFAVSNLILQELQLLSTRTNRSSRTIDIYDADAPKLIALSQKLQQAPYKYQVKPLNEAITALTGKSIGKVKDRIGNKVKTAPLSDKVVQSRIGANIYKPPAYEEFDREVSALYPGVFQVSAEQQAAQKNGMYFILGRGTSVLADEPGAGKCQIGSTLVNINDKVFTLADAWNAYVINTTPSNDGIGEFGELREPLFTHSINDTGQTVKGKITHIFRQNFNSQMLKYRTNNGRSITSTVSHKFLTDSEWKNNLLVDDIVCSSIRLPQLTDAVYCNTQLIEFLAWQIAEGCEYKNGNRLTITQKDTSVLINLKKIFDDFHFTSSKGTPVSATIATNNKGCTFLRLCSKDFVDHLTKLGYTYGEKSAKKSIPDFIMQSNIDCVKIFLRAIFDAEGYASKTRRSIGLTSASRKLIMQISVLLGRFGIIHTFHNKIKCATNTVAKTKRPYYELTIVSDGVDIFMREIGFGYQYKNDAILSQTTDRNVNKGCKPIHHILKPLVDRYKIPYRHLGISNQRYLTGKRFATNDKIEEIINALERISSGETLRLVKEKFSSKWTTSTVAIYESVKLEDVRSAIEQLHVMLNNDLVYETVVSVEEVDYDGYIYDLTVDKYHNYVAEGLICHNTAQSMVGADYATVLQDREAAQQAAAQGQVAPPKKRILVISPLPLIEEHWASTGGKQSKPESYLGQGADSVAIIRTLQDYNNIGPNVRWVVVPDSTIALANDKTKQAYGVHMRIAEDSKNGLYGASIIDELQKYKDLDSNSSESLRVAISASGIKHRIGLTGTPADNDPTDLYTQLRLTRHPILYDTAGTVQQTQKGFAEQFLGGAAYADKKDGAISRINSIFSWAKTVNNKLLIQLFSTTYLRRTKEQMRADLPTKTRTEPNAITGHEEHWNQRFEQLKQQEEQKAQAHLEKTGKKIGANPWGPFEREMAQAKIPHTVKQAIAHLQNPQNKLFVVTKQPDVAVQIAQQINAAMGDGTAAEVHGQIKDHLKQTIPNTFKQTNGIMPGKQFPLRCVVYTMRMGSVGLNFKVANKALFNDIAWNPSENLQAEDRIHRIDSQHPCEVEYTYFAGTYDQEMFDRVRQKEAVNANVNQILKEASDKPEEISRIAGNFVESLVESLLFDIHMNPNEKAYVEKQKAALRAFMAQQGQMVMNRVQEQVGQPQQIPVAAGSWYKNFKTAARKNRHLW